MNRHNTIFQLQLFQGLKKYKNLDYN